MGCVMQDYSSVTCCFSGYRIEKMPFRTSDCAVPAPLAATLEQAILRAAKLGYTRFLTGMSTGFDLWAADAVLRLRDAHGLQLLAAVPFEQQAQRFSPAWKREFNRVLLAADQVFVLSAVYHAGCYAARNRFMVEGASRLICYHDGQPGGTAQTLRLARQRGLAIDNLADGQLSFS